jgi:hypothetical protein
VRGICYLRHATVEKHLDRHQALTEIAIGARLVLGRCALLGRQVLVDVMWMIESIRMGRIDARPLALEISVSGHAQGLDDVVCRRLATVLGEVHPAGAGFDRVRIKQGRAQLLVGIHRQAPVVDEIKQILRHRA